MMTAIQWTDATWNPLAGCKEISPGCTNCYAASMAHRLEAMGQTKYAGTTRKLPNGKVVWTGKMNLDEAALNIPLRTRKPTRFFVNSMSDLFHKDVPDEFIDKVFAVMAMSQDHTFQVLTKRPQRMLAYLRMVDEERDMNRWANHAAELAGSPCAPGIFDELDYPLRNVWLGVSVEDQQRADERIPLLLQTPAAVRFLSCEPLLGPVDLHVCSDFSSRGHGPSWMLPIASGAGGVTSTIHWVIVGGESGPRSRECNLEWIMNIVNQCHAANVPVFVKQLGTRPYIDHSPVEAAKIAAKHGVGPLVAEFLQLKDKKGGNMDEWPWEELCVREFPQERNL